ncbi:MAG: exodeoxyribonuclease VII small subunit [Gammaproteobacteria bacterium]|jgi:exodeoxyribonuclease VII small subunit|nr:exodeoxyribonuclease VII small subunit [Gammaproteobacteria bacterium]
MAAGKDKDINLEQALGELESLVEEMESGDLPLEEAMKKFERGITLTRECQTALRDAEQKVEVLMKKAGGSEETGPFEPGV